MIQKANGQQVVADTHRPSGPTETLPPQLSPPRDPQPGLTTAAISAALNHVIYLADPFPIALEEDLGGGHRLAHQQHGLVLYNVHILGLYQEVGKQVWVGTRYWIGHCGTLLGTCKRRKGREDVSQVFPGPGGGSWRSKRPNKCSLATSLLDKQATGNSF